MPLPGSGTKRGQLTFLRDCTFDDIYASHRRRAQSLGLLPKVYGELDPAGLYGVWWYKRREARTVRAPLPLWDGHYRKEKQIRKRPKDEWIPVPASEVRLKTLVQVRRLLDGASQVLRGSDAFLGTLRAS